VTSTVFPKGKNSGARKVGAGARGRGNTSLLEMGERKKNRVGGGWGGGGGEPTRKGRGRSPGNLIGSETERGCAYQSGREGGAKGSDRTQNIGGHALVTHHEGGGKATCEFGNVKRPQTSRRGSPLIVGGTEIAFVEKRREGHLKNRRERDLGGVKKREKEGFRVARPVERKTASVGIRRKKKREGTYSRCGEQRGKSGGAIRSRG